MVNRTISGRPVYHQSREHPSPKNNRTHVRVNSYDYSMGNRGRSVNPNGQIGGIGCCCNRVNSGAWFAATSPKFLLLVVLVLVLPSFDNGGGVLGCGPGRGGGRRPSLRKLTPLVFKQHVPNVSENTLSASGSSEDRVSRHDTKFRDLVPNYNADIIFKDEEGTGADRLMTQRCKEKLNTLAISVMNQWPGVKLRVTEGWDEEGKHATGSLHYEGRAVDVTTSDRDRSKYGMLARLAVEAGFDWVYYESRSHIHCSVKSESSSVGKSGGCFPGKSVIRTSEGTSKRIEDLTVGERVEAVDDRGDLVYSEVIAFLDRGPDKRRQFVELTTSTNRRLTLTGTHLLPANGGREIFAFNVKINDLILVSDPTNVNSTSPINHDVPASRLRWDRVVSVKHTMENGVYAPLTMEGNILVDNVVASCYAVIDSQTIAHFSFMPLRIYNRLTWTINKVVRRFANVVRFFETTNTKVESRGIVDEVDDKVSVVRDSTKLQEQSEGVHWYASLLYSLSSYVLPRSIMY